MPFVVSSTIPVPTPSDHRLAVVSLLPRVTSTMGPGLPRLHTSFLGLADLKQRFAVWVKDECEQRPSDPGMLLEWWPGFKRWLSCQVVALNRQAWHRRLTPRLRVRLAMEAAAMALSALDTQGVSAHRLSRAVEDQDQVVSAIRADRALSLIHI